MQNFEQIRRHISAGNYRVTMQDPYVMCVELSLDSGRRHQAIFLSELHDDDGRHYLRVNTVIAPITGIDARRALAFNWRSRIGYLAIDELDGRSEEHTSELQSLMRISYAVFCLKKNIQYR